MATISPYRQTNLGPYWPYQKNTLTRFTIKTTSSRNHRFQWKYNLIYTALDKLIESVREQQTILWLRHKILPEIKRASAIDTHLNYIHSINSKEAIA